MKAKAHRLRKTRAPATHLGPAGRRERHRVELRERLFRAALQLFAGKGFEETTVEDITNAADVGKGTFFNYFPSKDHILIAFGEMQLGKLRTLVEEARRTSEPIPQILRKISQRMTEEPGRNPEILRMILLANLSGKGIRAAMREVQEAARGLHQQLIEIGQQRGEIRTDRPAEEIAHTFRQMVFGTLLLWSLCGDVPLKERIDSAFELLWGGIAAPRAAIEAGVRD
jgi:AcrR family transcriptional regulator